MCKYTCEVTIAVFADEAPQELSEPDFVKLVVKTTGNSPVCRAFGCIIH